MSVSVDRRGTGSPVVLVHGLGSRWQVFAPVLDLIADAGHEAIAVDLPGFGDSPLAVGVTPGPYGYAAWLTAWLASEGIERPHLVGNSMGGGISLELGRAGVAASVTAFSPIGFWKTPGVVWTQALLTTLRGASSVARPMVDRALDHKPGRVALLAPLFGHPSRVDPAAARIDLDGLIGGAGFPAARDSFRDYAVRPGDDLGGLADIPVTVAWGTRDVLLPYRPQSARARAALPAAHHVDLPGCGHLPFHDAAELCAGVVLETVAKTQEKS